MARSDAFFGKEKRHGIAYFFHGKLAPANIKITLRARAYSIDPNKLRLIYLYPNIFRKRKEVKNNMKKQLPPP
jgi:hypothetical protein